MSRETMKVCLVILAASSIVALSARAEEPPALDKFYRLHFAIQEVDGTKIVNSREYDTTSVTNSPKVCIIRTASHVNLPVSPNMYQNYSLDVRIDASGLREIPGGLALEVEAVINTLSQEPVIGSNPEHGPVVRENSWKSTLLVPTKRATVIFSSDDLTSKHKMQLVLTATPVL